MAKKTWISDKRKKHYKRLRNYLTDLEGEAQDYYLCKLVYEPTTMGGETYEGGVDFGFFTEGQNGYKKALERTQVKKAMCAECGEEKEFNWKDI